MKHINKGFTLFETILVLSIFSLIGVMITSIMASSIKSVKKSQNLIKVKSATTRIVDIIERQIRSSKHAVCEVDYSKISFTDEYGNNTYFEYDDTTYNLASGAATPYSPVNLNPDDITVTSASFICGTDPETGLIVVDFSISAQVGIDAVESATAEFSTKITPRNK